VRVVVVGAGIVGLAAASAVQQACPDAEVTVIEKENEVGRHQTSHNSGVVHAGLYYAPGSLKARLCRRGVELLRAYCAERGLPYEECGKVLVATLEGELPRLEKVFESARANGVPDVSLLSGDELRMLEPSVAGIAGLHSPSTAIVDFQAVARALAVDVQGSGGRLLLGTAVASVLDEGDHAAVTLSDGSTVPAERVLVCAGLHSDRLARASRRPAAPRIIPFRGEYYALKPACEGLVRGLIYPVPDPSLPFLGVHLTRTIGRGVLVGPNAVLALSREGYRRRTVNMRDVADLARWRGTWRMARVHWRVGAAEMARSASKRAFVRAARRYVPELRARDVVPALAGVRAQAVDVSGSLVDDFCLDRTRHVVWVRNAPSPGATSSLALGEELAERLALTR
jgi:L-2-hydroxyglutarate oxidase LhgO